MAKECLLGHALVSGTCMRLFFVDCAMVKFTNMSYVSKVDTVSVIRAHKSVTVVLTLLSSESHLVIHLVLFPMYL